MRISNLSNKSGNPSSSDYFVLDDGTTVTKIDYNKLAKAIIENYAGSTVAGSAQSVKAALDSLNSKIPTRVKYRVASATAISWAGRYYQDVDVSSVIPSNKRIASVTLGSATEGGVMNVWLQGETVVRLIDTSDFSGKALHFYLELI